MPFGINANLRKILTLRILFMLQFFYVTAIDQLSLGEPARVIKIVVTGNVWRVGRTLYSGDGNTECVQNYDGNIS